MARKAVHGGGSMETGVVEVLSGVREEDEILNADVLDAWYDPSPKAVKAVSDHLPWLMKTSPPTHGEGLREVIAEARGVPVESVLLGAGSSSLMFLAFPRLLDRESTMLVLDPMYGEYVHLGEEVIGCEVKRFELEMDDFRVDVGELVRASEGVDLVVLVNPNSPTGVAMNRGDIEEFLGGIEGETSVWIDETYIDFLSEAEGGNESAEELVSEYPNLIVSKSLSKFYGLSGLRVGYLVASIERVRAWEGFSAPWSVGLLAYVAATECLGDREYYSAMARETEVARESMARELRGMNGVDRVIDGVANYLMIRLEKAVAGELCELTKEDGVYLRNCDSLSRRFENETVRIAVKSPEANRRVLASLRAVLARLC